MSETKPRLVVIAGPTAVGKSEIAIKLAQRVRGEIVTADSMQVYRGMDIGTAKPRPSERGGIPHHMIDVCDPDRRFNVAEYTEMALEVIHQVHRRGNLPIVAGGTGLYIKAIQGEFRLPGQGPDLPLRAGLEEFARTEGPEALYQRLANVDPRAAKRIHPNDVRRVVRALEVYEATGTPLTEHLDAIEDAPRRFESLDLCLVRPREVLYERIEKRVLQQVEEGLVDEVRALKERFPDMPVARQALGYKEILAYLEGRLAWDEAISLLMRDTRRFAKRQLTWFRREASMEWIDLEAATSYDEVTDRLEEKVRKFLG